MKISFNAAVINITLQWILACLTLFMKTRVSFFCMLIWSCHFVGQHVLGYWQFYMVPPSIILESDYCNILVESHAHGVAFKKSFPPLLDFQWSQGVLTQKYYLIQRNQRHCFSFENTVKGQNGEEYEFAFQRFSPVVLWDAFVCKFTMKPYNAASWLKLIWYVLWSKKQPQGWRLLHVTDVRREGSWANDVCK